MKTIREHLNSLPEPYRTEAFEATKVAPKSTLEDNTRNSYSALYKAFDWRYTKQGFYYWNSLYEILLQDKQTYPTPPQSSPPVPNNRSDSNDEHKVFATKKPIINPLFQIFSDPSFVSDQTGAPYFIYDHDKF